MSKENKNSTSKRKREKQKEVKLTAVERRRLQREQERREESRFSAFEPASDDSKPKKFSPTDQSRFSNFDVESKKDTDDYFERLYGGTPNEGERDKARSEHTHRKKDEREISKKKYADKNFKVKEISKRQRKTRTVLSYVGVFLVIVFLTALMSLTVMFKTTEIIVNGEDLPYSREEIIETSGLKYNENIFLAKRKAAVKKIVDHYPYIEAAQVSFRIPGTQIITVEKAVPSFQVAVSEGFAIVSAKGRILEIVGAQRANIPLLRGLKLTDSREGQYISFEKNTTQKILNEVITNINDNKVPNIYGIDISNSANIKLNYDNRITILLGVPEDVGYKLRTAMAIINDELAATDKGDLDVSLASSERKSSYFTPIYTNTVNIDDNSLNSSKSSSSSSEPSSADSGNGSVNIKSAEEYFEENGSAISSEDDNYDYIDDIIDDYEYDNEEEAQNESLSEQREQNIISNYGTNYNY